MASTKAASRNIPPEIQVLLEAHDYESLEDQWLQRLSSHPSDVETFTAIARSVAAGEDGDPDHARFLLQLVDEQLQTRGMWHERLQLLRLGGSLLLEEGEEVHPHIVETLESLYADRSIFAGMAEDVGLFRATHDLAKTWDKVDRLHQIMPYDVGTIVAMEGRGVGTVSEVNYQLSKLRVEFLHGTPLNVGFRAAAKMLEPLPPEHILRRKVEEPEVLEGLEAPDLLRVVLESRGREMTAGEIRQDLAGVVDDDRWSSWWTAARKHPQVVVHGKGRQTYSWAASEDHALDTVWSAFEAAEPRKKMDLLRREGERDEALARRMAADLESLGREAAADDPGLAFELWCALERAGLAPQDDELPIAPAALLAGTAKRVQELLAGVADRSLRERALREVRQRRDDWHRIFLDRMPKEEDSKALDLMLDELEADGDVSKELGRFFDGLLAQPHRSPAAFVWLAERAKDDAALRCRNPLRLLQQIFTSIGRDEFASYRQRLRDLLVKGATVGRLFAELQDDQASAAEEALYRAGFLEEYEREELQRALLLRFPGLKGETAALDVLWATPSSIAAKRAQLEEIAKKELPANRKAIQVAREMGDLRENFEYKAARQRHELLTSLATKINAELSRARAIDPESVDPSQVRVGTRVRLAGDGGERTLTVLGPWESAPEAGVISYESELAQKLLGKAVGDTVDGETVEAIEVAEIS
jgi:transcription elongation GreA/GreB family factor